MNDDALRSLIQDVDDYLDAGHVGLYEFLWILNGEKVPGSREEHLQIAQKALEHLVENKRGRLISVMWAQPGTEKDLDRDVRPEDFNDPQDGPYVAITRD